MPRQRHPAWLLIPTILFPYVVIVNLLFFFFLQDYFPSSNVLISRALDIAVIVTFFLAILFNIIYMIASRALPARRVLRTALIVKAIHIPAYLCIFLFAIPFAIMIFMALPMVLILVFLDGLSLFLSGMISIYALSKVCRQKAATTGIIPVLAIIGQFFFCIDVITVFFAFFTLKKPLATPQPASIPSAPTAPPATDIQP